MKVEKRGKERRKKNSSEHWCSAFLDFDSIWNFFLIIIIIGSSFDEVICGQETSPHSNSSQTTDRNKNAGRHYVCKRTRLCLTSKQWQQMEGENINSNHCWMLFHLSPRWYWKRSNPTSSHLQRNTAPWRQHRSWRRLGSWNPNWSDSSSSASSCASTELFFEAACRVSSAEMGVFFVLLNSLTPPGPVCNSLTTDWRGGAGATVAWTRAPCWQTVVLF